MNRSQTPIHQPENYQFYPYVGGQQHIIPRGYIQSGNYYQVIQPMIVPVFQMQQSNNSNNKHQQQIINQQHQQQPNPVIIKKQYQNMITNKPAFRPWTSEEDQHIMNMVKMHGAAWDGIARTLPDRTGLDVQNRYSELKNRIGLPMPSIQSRASNSYYEDADAVNEIKEDNYSSFIKHISYSMNNNIGMDSFSLQNHNSENFEFIRSQEDEQYQDIRVLPFISPDNEFNGIDI